MGLVRSQGSIYLVDDRLHFERISGKVLHPRDVMIDRSDGTEGH